ncbi:MAG TPA: Mor transcription activator family protein [Thiobacillaceae bacterium]|nr:Mor transcription activator family protein [Thiobacillaceae bacterium]
MKFEDFLAFCFRFIEKKRGRPITPEEKAMVRDRLRAEYGGKRLVIPGPSKLHAETRDRNIRNAYQCGISAVDLASRYGLSRAAIYKILNNKKEPIRQKK